MIRRKLTRNMVPNLQESSTKVEAAEIQKRKGSCWIQTFQQKAILNILLQDPVPVKKPSLKMRKSWSKEQKKVTNTTEN